MSFFTWKPEYSVGVARFDADHRNIVATLNELNEAMSKGQGRDVLAPILDRLINYTQTHFAAEERAMTASGYPQLATHKEEHRKLVARVVDFKQRFDSGKTLITVELMRFLKDWLSEHILGTDRLYGPHLNDSGVN